MKQIIKQTLVATFIFAALIALTIYGCGCVSPNNDKTPGAPPYVVDPKLSENVGKAQALNTGLAPVNPYSPVTGEIIAGVGGLVALVSTIIAKKKNDAAKSHSAAAASLAETVINAGLAAPAMKDAIRNRASDSVAKHIDNATPSA